MKKLIFLLSISFIIVGCSSEKLRIEENMVLVKGGEFLLGKENVTNHFVHIRLDNYYISKYEVTVEEWEQFLKETKTPYQWKDEYTDMREESPFPDSPIEVSWNLAIQYANWVSRKYELEECYIIDGDDVEWNRDANGYRLLTDAEWEYAARGGKLSKGFEYAGSNDLDEVAWTGWNSDNHTHPVGTKKANELGLFDMSGNADEWCWDLDEDYPYDKSILLVNPVGPNLADYLTRNDMRWRIARGGCYGTADEFPLTPYHRSGLYELGVGSGGDGIRLARNAAD